MAVAAATKLNKKPVKNGIKYMTNALLIFILTLSVLRYITGTLLFSRLSIRIKITFY